MAVADKNYWLDEACARAFWDQKLALPYQELLRDTARWLQPEPGERWLDLGCGGGQLTALLWQLSGGRLGGVTALDCNGANAGALDGLRRRLSPVPPPDRLRFVVGNFSDGLGQFGPESFDGVVSGLAISYAESRDPATGRYTDAAYNRLLADLGRVLRPGGRLVFSVNVPRVRFWPIFWKSLRHPFRLSRPGRALANGLRMQAYGSWLRREAARGRFHYLTVEEIRSRLHRVGFEGVQHALSYAGQAYVIAARKADGRRPYPPAPGLS
jgi:SAM-dependent methyltransferase